MSFTQVDLLEHGPVPFWFWNDRLQVDEIDRQVRLMRDGGVRNFIIHARWGLKTPYLSREWWKMIKAAVAAAKACGSRAWIYDEYNYPSGICGFKLTRQARFRERFLAQASVLAQHGKGVELALPKGSPLAVWAYPVKAGKLSLEGAQQVPLRKDQRRLRWSPPDSGTWRLSAFCMQVEPFKGSGRYSVNYLAPEPTREFLRLTHEAYRRELGPHFGRTVPGFFLDEPRFNNALPFDERFAAEFKRRRGYDLLPRLALLLHPGPDAETRQARQHYRQTLGELYTENFFAPIGRWCKRHKVELTGHLMAEETLAGAARFSGEALGPYAHFSIPGCDHLGKGIGGLAPRVAASMAAQQGKPRVSCEAFAGCGQDFSPQEMQLITHWLFAQGVNLIVPHAFFYAMRTARQKADWPPSMFFQWAHWPSYKGYAQRVARLAASLSGGKSLADVALLHPGKAFAQVHLAEPAYKTGYFKKGPDLGGIEARALEHWYQWLGQTLPQRHHTLHIVGEADLGRLKGYRWLLLPAEPHLGAKALRQMAAFKAAGGRVLQGDDPQALLRQLEGQEKAPDLRLSGARGLQGRLWDWDTRIHDPYLHQNLDAVLKKDLGGIAVHHYRRKGEDLYLLANLSGKARSFNAELRCQAPRVQLRWPGDGRVEAALGVKRLAGGRSRLKLSIPAFESVLVAFTR